jgi:hypothetical protein
MNFRWVALIALWTLLAGPIFAGPPGKAGARQAARVRTAPAVGSAVKP